MNKQGYQTVTITDPLILVTVVGDTKILTWREPGAMLYTSYLMTGGALHKKVPAGISEEQARAYHYDAIQRVSDNLVQGQEQWMSLIKQAIYDGLLVVAPDHSLRVVGTAQTAWTGVLTDTPDPESFSQVKVGEGKAKWVGEECLVQQSTQRSGGQIVGELSDGNNPPRDGEGGGQSAPLTSRFLKYA